MANITTQTKKSKSSSAASKSAATPTGEQAESACPARKRPTKSKSAEQVEGSTAVTPEQRMAWIAEAAYYRAERRGFCGGDDTADWFAAEAEVDAMLLSDKPKAE